MSFTPIPASPGIPNSDDPLNDFDDQWEGFNQWADDVLRPGVNAAVVEITAQASTASGAASTATTAAGTATTQAGLAAAYAGSALNAPGTSATSITSLTVAAGLKAVVLQQTGKAITDGQNVVIALATDPANVRMVGVVDGANPGTGALPVRVSSGDVRGSGTYNNWVISMAGEGTAMPDPTAANASKVPTVLNGGGYGLVTPRGTGGATATGNVTLTAASPAVQLLTPAGPGQWVQLADATTVPVGEGLHALCNLGGHDVEIRNALGTPLGYIQGGTTVSVSSQSAGSAAGAWCLDGASAFGILSAELSFALSVGTGTSPALVGAVSLDDNRELLLFGGDERLYGAVWDGSSSSFGTPTLIRTAAVMAYVRAVKSATDQALVVSVNGSTGLEGVALTITGTSIAVGTAATATLGGAISSLDDLLGIAGQGFTLLYRRAGGTGVRALTVTGTTVAIGSEAISGNDVSLVPAQFDGGNGKQLLVGHNGTNVIVELRTVAGTTLTSGTGVTLGVGQPMSRQLASGRLAVVYDSSGARGAIISVSGTVASASATASGAASSPNLTFAHAAGNQLIYGYTAGNVAYIGSVTDNAGTAVAGTEIARLPSGTNSSPYLIATDASSATVFVVPSAATSATGYIARIGMSGNNPVVQAARYVTSSLYADGGYTQPYAATPAGKEPLPPSMLRGSLASVAGLAAPRNFLWVTRAGIPTLVPAVPSLVLVGGQGGRRASAGNWEWSGALVRTSFGIAVQRIKVA